MNFDIISMKQRAKALMKETKPKPALLGAIFAALLVLYWISLIVIIVKEKYVFMLLAELLYLNFRNCLNWYGLKVTRNEKTSVADAFSAFINRPISTILFGVLRDIMYAIGFILVYIGSFVPMYCFRFTAYILKDENINIFSAMKKSMTLMKGHYVELFKLDISNLGWYILMIVTFGIAGIYVKPYTAIIYAEFYDYLKAQHEMLG